MVLSVRRRIAGIARAEPDRAALVGFGTDLTEQVLSWRAGNTVPAAIGIAAAPAAEVPVFPPNPGTPPAERDTLLGLLGLRQRVGRSDYVNDRAVRTTVDGFATVGDRGRLDRDGYLYLEPRDHDTINVGGEKVDPDAHVVLRPGVRRLAPYHENGAVPS